MNPLSHASIAIKACLLAACCSLGAACAAMPASNDYSIPHETAFSQMTEHPGLDVQPVELTRPTAIACASGLATCARFEGAAGEQLVEYFEAAESNTKTLRMCVNAYDALADETDLIQHEGRLLEASYNRLGRMYAEAEADVDRVERWQAADAWISRIALLGVAVAAVAE